MQQDRRVGAPADEYLIAPVDRPLRGTPLVLEKYRNYFTGRRLDAVGRSVAQVTQLPDRTPQLVHTAGADRLLAEANLLRPQRHPDPLADTEASDVINQQVAAGLGALHRDQSRLGCDNGTFEQIRGADEIRDVAAAWKLIDLR